MIRLGTFNVENLFSRPKVFNYVDHTKGDEKLALISELQGELEKQQYDKARILDLYDQLKAFIKINERRSKLLNRSRNQVLADGRDDWDGFIELKREKFSDTARLNTGKVIRAVDADILCMVEVDNRPSLNSFDRERLRTSSFNRYTSNLLIDGNDPRGIDLGLFTRRPFAGAWTHMWDGTTRSRTFSRDCLEVQIPLTDTTNLWVLLNHFKSKSGNPVTGDARRKRQAQAVTDILVQDYDLESDFVVVMGDLNDTPESDPLDPLMRLPNLLDVLKLEFPNDPGSRWTYHYNSNEQIDYILVSEPLADLFVKAGVERRGMHKVDQYSNGQVQPFSTVTSRVAAASDHAAVWADFAL